VEKLRFFGSQLSRSPASPDATSTEDDQSGAVFSLAGVSSTSFIYVTFFWSKMVDWRISESRHSLFEYSVTATLPGAPTT